jgi:hypothetical protein
VLGRALGMVKFAECMDLRAAFSWQKFSGSPKALHYSAKLVQTTFLSYSEDFPHRTQVGCGRFD